jgi:hypothetical protein
VEPREICEKLKVHTIGHALNMQGEKTDRRIKKGKPSTDYEAVTTPNF